MGTWGVGLYDDDKAADLTDSIAVLAKIPATGARLLEILLKQAGHTPELTDAGGPTFWLVIADQFERRGIRCAMAFDRALTAIESGLDLKDLEDRGQDQKDIAKRKSILDELAKRLRSPRPERKIPENPKLPDAVVQVGEVYAFPTMAGLPFASHGRSAADFDRRAFVPDGWGAIAILDQARAFDWIPWCAVASVSVDPSRFPELREVVNGELLYHAQTNGATRCLPKRSELERVPFRFIERVELDRTAAQAVVAHWPNAEQAVELGWEMRAVAFGSNCRFMSELPRGPQLAALVANH